MKRIHYIILGIALLFLGGAFAVSARTATPEGVDMFQRPDGAWCITDHRSDGPHTFCDCPCEDVCIVESTSAPTQTPIDVLKENPTKTPKPTKINTLAPTETFVPDLTETNTPDPTETKVHTAILTNTETPVPTELPTLIPTQTPGDSCFQWICHMPGTPAEQDYCCDSEGCVRAHLAPPQNGYLGKCNE